MEKLLIKILNIPLKKHKRSQNNFILNWYPCCGAVLKNVKNHSKMKKTYKKFPIAKKPSRMLKILIKCCKTLIW